VATSSAAVGGPIFDAAATDGSTMDFTAGTLPTGNLTTRVYKDGYKNPVGYCRFGSNTELQNPPYVNTKSTSYDPLDPTGKLATWFGTLSTAQKTAILSTLFLSNSDPANATSLNGTNRLPVVFSIGLNGTYESLDMNPVNIKGDDVLGYRLVQIGQRGTQ
jgi:hypothetical protein